MQTGHGYVITTNELHPLAPYGDNENAKYPGTGAYVISPDDRDPWLLLATYNLVRGWEAFHRANNFEKAENGSMVWPVPEDGGEHLWDILEGYGFFIRGEMQEDDLQVKQECAALVGEQGFLVRLAGFLLTLCFMF